MFDITFRRWLDSNRGPLESEETALPTEPNHCPTVLNFWVSFLFNIFSAVIPLIIIIANDVTPLSSETFWVTFNWKCCRVKLELKLMNLPKFGVQNIEPRLSVTSDLKNTLSRVEPVTNSFRDLHGLGYTGHTL